MFATGGYGRAFKINSNAHANTGDALSIVARRGLPLEDMEFVQFHPSGLGEWDFNFWRWLKVEVEDSFNPKGGKGLR